METNKENDTKAGKKILKEREKDQRRRAVPLQWLFFLSHLIFDNPKAYPKNKTIKNPYITREIYDVYVKRKR